MEMIEGRTLFQLSRLSAGLAGMVASLAFGQVGESELQMGKIHKLKPSQKQAEDAVRTLLSWAGDDPDRQGLRDTPGRVARAYKEWFKGYGEDPEALAAADLR